MRDGLIKCVVLLLLEVIKCPRGALTCRGVEHRFVPHDVMLLLEVMKCPTMGYDLAWCGEWFSRVFNLSLVMNTQALG